MSFVAARWLRRRRVPILLDVKDQWPEVFLRPVPQSLRRTMGAIAWPYSLVRDKTFRMSTGISSTSEEFLDWCLDQAGRRRASGDIVLPLTTAISPIGEEELSEARRWWNAQGIGEQHSLLVSYVGSVNTALDLEPVFRAAQKLPSVDFVIAGEGPSYSEVKAWASRIPNLIAPGFLDQPKKEALAERSAVALVPYVNEHGFTLGVPNKVFDALAHGQVVVSSLSGSVERLLSGRGVGHVYDDERGTSLAQVIQRLESQPEAVESMGSRAQELFDREFDSRRVYGSLVDHLQAMSDRSREATSLDHRLVRRGNSVVRLPESSGKKGRHRVDQ